MGLACPPRAFGRRPKALVGRSHLAKSLTACLLDGSPAAARSHRSCVLRHAAHANEVAYCAICLLGGQTDPRKHSTIYDVTSLIEDRVHDGDQLDEELLARHQAQHNT
jgi:hypothetical protein